MQHQKKPLIKFKNFNNHNNLKTTKTTFMKKILLSIALLLSAGIAARAQAPQLLNYQGVARNSTGTPLASVTIGLRLTIHDATAGGTVLYQETQTPPTNGFGLYNANIGAGTVVSGTFSSINWGSGPKYLQVEIDPAGGSSYTNAGTAQLLSAPYSIYSNTAGSVTGGLTGSGTTNYLSKFTSSSALGNSNVFDNGTTVGIDTSTPTSMAKLQVNGVGVYGSPPYWQAGIVANGAPTAGSASGIYGESGWRGVYGRNPGTAIGTQAIGVHGRCEGSSYTGGGYGVLAEAVGTGPTNYGIYATGSGAATNYAGYFNGNVHITGSISKGSGTFMIDHPLDPENKYLYHSFVESPDMMNIYNGNAVTDASGTATVIMPDYFEALNKDFRYQLTVIGTFAQAIIAEKINGNQFKIKTDKPNVEVSWMVTGVRQDKYANAHRVVPEVEKEPQFKGRYLHAREWGMPDSKSIDALRESTGPNGDNTVEAK
jgi:hypothetical protein